MIIYPDSPRLRDIARDWQTFGKRPTEIEIPGPDEESVWDYPRPPYLKEIDDLFEVRSGSQLILKASWAIKVAETASPPTYYFRSEDFLCDLNLEETTSLCEWKGEATYYSIKDLKSVAWSYLNPHSEYEALAGLISFYPGKFKTTFNGEAVLAQPGSFYAGWVTSKVKGPFKGEPGSQNW